MAGKDIKPFNGLSILTSEMDEIEVGHLLKANQSLSLVCQDCGGRRFHADAFIPAELEIISSTHIAVARIDYREILVNRVTKCVHCEGTDFVTINEAEEDNGQKQSGAG